MPRITQSGFNTSAIFGFVNTLEELLRKERPSHLAVCFDPAGPTFRHETMESYKGERESTPEDIKLSIPYIKDIIRAYNIPILEVAGFEADDVIGTMAKRAEKEGFTTYMMTPDKDFGQLVTDTVLQYKPSYRGQDIEIRGPKEVCGKYGLQNPLQVIDLLALMGDKVDNIPGCPGVGEKTAVKLINEFGSMEKLLASTEALKGALKRKVEENVEMINLSKYLATIRTDVPIDATPDDLVCKAADKDKLFAIFRELEFKTLEQRVLKRLESGATVAMEEAVEAPTAPTELAELPLDWIIITDKKHLSQAASKLAKARECGIYLHTTGEKDVEATWHHTAIILPTGENYIIPTYYAEGVALVLDTLARTDLLKVTFNAKRDYVVAAQRRHDDAVAVANYYDVSIAHYLLEPELRHDCETLAATYLGLKMAEEAETAPRTTLSLFDDEEEITPSQALRSAQTARIAFMLRQPLQEIIEKENMKSLLEDIELPVARVLAEMECVGVRLDVAALKSASVALQAKMTELEQQIYDLAGEQFNIASPGQVGEILFTKLHLDDKAKKTKTGQYSTGEAVLEKLAPKHPIVPLIMEHRQLKKLVNTWLSALPEAISPVTGRIHTNYNQTVTATGRLSSSNPNLQNIPVRDDMGKEIRRAFIADPGCVFLSADYSQIELRLVADFAKDETMISAFNNGDDIHRITASKIYKEPLEDVTATQRRNAKTANFGILYGISAFGLAARLGIPRDEAKMLIEGYNTTFPKVHKFMSDTVEHARENGYVVTMLGRKRKQPDINSRNHVVRGYAERNAINAPIQGSAADIIKIAMVAIAEEMRQRHLKSRMIMQVHDELNFNVPQEEVETMRELVVRNMENAYHGTVRLEAACGVGPDWLTAH
jgi:DNA polymerase-1